MIGFGLPRPDSFYLTVLTPVNVASMTLSLPLAEDLGTRLSDGSRAAEYRMGRIDPYVGVDEKIVLDFTGVRNANSSFVNALITGTLEQHGEAVLSKMTFKGCTPAIQVLVEAAIYLGLSKTENRVL